MSGKQIHRFDNIKLQRRLSDGFWDAALQHGVHDLVVDRGGARFTVTGLEQECLNMSAYSYLGLDENQKIVDGALEALEKARALNSSLSRVRIRLQMLDAVEDALGDLFNTDVGTVSSCAAGAWSILPLIASGLMTGGKPPLMVFDQYAHFCLRGLKAVCADETQVKTIRHNNLEALEELCRKHAPVAYVADSVYSTGESAAPIEELLDLQARYELILFFDDAHGTSVVGKNGVGPVLDRMGVINDKTVVVTSLNKGFGASGGAIFYGPRGGRTMRNHVLRSGGPFMWSQRLNTAALGAIMASIDIHRSPELPLLQDQLVKNVQEFDSSGLAADSDNTWPVRFIRIGDEQQTIDASRKLLERGFYVEPDFFPVVARGHAGLRVRIRANMGTEDLARFTEAAREVLSA